MKIFSAKTHSSVCCRTPIAFTLAEILITVGIIGIVAAITISTLMNNFKKNEYASALKNSFAQTNQVLSLMAQDHGCVDDLKCTGLFDNGVSNDTLGKEFVKYFKILKDCGATTNQKCWADKINNFYDGSSTSILYINANNHYKFVTIDGVSYAIHNYGKNCDQDWGNSVVPYMQQTCAELIIDVNGVKGPNCKGRDAFWFYITNKKGARLYPTGGRGDNISGWWKNANPVRCSAGGTKNGYYCSGRLIEENWVMNY